MGQQEDQLIRSRFSDTIAACRPHRPSFYGFLDEREVSLLTGVALPLVKMAVFWGGREHADRVMAGVFDNSDYCSNPDPELQERKRRSAFPIVCLRITPAGAGRNFIERMPEHRDYLGALMGLGIKRQSVGDIVCDEQGAWVWCDAKIADFIRQNLKSVGRCSVSCTADAPAPSETGEKPERVVDLSDQKCYNKLDSAELSEIGVSSPRLDALLAGLAHVSRQKAEQLLLSGAVRYNYLECTEKDRPVCAGDVFSVSRLGKYRVIRLQVRGKKGRTYILLSKYQ